MNKKEVIEESRPVAAEFMKATLGDVQRHSKF